MEKYEIGLAKKSFSLYYNGGEIWCEHLDSLYSQTEMLRQKFLQDLITISRPSTSSYIAVALEESEIDQEILDLMIESFLALQKPLRRVVFVGLRSKMKSYIKKKAKDISFSIICIDDFEKAKEWLIR